VSVGSPPASGQEPASAGASFHVRAADASAAELLELGNSASPSFRRLVEVLERSDLIVFVQTRPLPIPGQLELAGAAAGFRYVRVSVRVPGRDHDLVAWLGHELQHAVELAEAPEVVDQDGLLRHYERIGARRGRASVETAAAQAVWRKILDEVKFRR
jgi:hypothetical protein